MRRERVHAFFQNVWLRPAMRLGKEQELAACARRADGAEADVMTFGRVFQAVPGSNQHRQLLTIRKIRWDDQDQLVLGFWQALRLPSLPAPLPLAAVVFQGNDDGK